jgi:hypothetical protein
MIPLFIYTALPRAIRLDDYGEIESKVRCRYFSGPATLKPATKAACSRGKNLG